MNIHHYPMAREIREAVALSFDLSPAELQSADRHRCVAWPRQMAMYLTRALTIQSLPAIGRAYGNRDHTTVIHAVKAVQERLLDDPETGEQLEAICRDLANVVTRRTASFEAEGA